MSMKPFSYSPREYDDWGMIRNGNGNLVLTLCAYAADEKPFDEHRRDKTDPYKVFGEKIVRALNESEIL